ncbi:MAG: single-stranded DNA-binding protein [Spirochaetaceae bacterium]|nr:MAG: single-stranded DNA-binding protein [Spirochaetaceae bacterium]
MNNLNSILIDGNLTADPELKETSKGTPVCNFRLAANRFYRQGDEMQKEVSYFDVETWAQSAERCSRELGKGRNVRVVGRLKQDRWTDDEGQGRSRIKIVADHVELGPRPKSEVQAEEKIVSGEVAGSEFVAAAITVDTEVNTKKKGGAKKQEEPLPMPF